jgi:hypothetical protein
MTGDVYQYNFVTGRCVSQYNVPESAFALTNVLGPASITGTLSGQTPYSGNNLISTCADAHNYGIAWGYSNSMTYQLKDQNGSNITGGN